MREDDLQEALDGFLSALRLSITNAMEECGFVESRGPDSYDDDEDWEEYVENIEEKEKQTLLELTLSARPYTMHMSKGCQCERCPLSVGAGNDCRGPVPDDGGDYSIVAVGEAPGEDEDRVGKPFVGKSGKLLRDALEAIGFPMDKVTFTNVVKCRPPDNKLKAQPIKCCYTSVPIRRNTKLVLLLGGTPLKAVLGETGITQWNGVIVDRDGIMYAPMYHPAYMLYNQSEEIMDAWLGAMANALDAYQHGLQDPADADIEYLYPVTDTEIATMCAHLRSADMISFDTEVSSLDPFHPDNRMLAMSFSDGNRAWAILVDHPDAEDCVSDSALDMVIHELENHPFVIGHNIKFDQMMVDHMLGCKFEAAGDTMLMSFLAESKQGIHGLKRLAGYYLGMFEYDKELSEYVRDHKDCDYNRGGSYANIPYDILLPYAARDAAATWKLYPVLYELLTPKQLILLEQLTIPASNALYRMQLAGIAVDFDVADRYRRLYGSVMLRLEERIQSDPMVFMYVDRKYEKYLKEHPRGSLPRERFAFNPGSSTQKADVLYGKKYYALKPNGATDTGKPSTRRDYLEPYRKSIPLVDDMIMYSMLGKMMGTYIMPVATRSKLNADGRARSSFNQHVVETGRLSSSGVSSTLGFNQQNIPTPEKEAGTILQYQPIKNMFTHTHAGGAFMQVDYSGMELRVFASLAKCEAMIEIHRSGKDFHTMVAVMTSGLSEAEITKPIRYRYKWTNWTILYRGNEYTLNRLYGIPLEEGKETIRTYFDRFPEVPIYQQSCIDFARKHGYIETPFGNRRPLPDIDAPEENRRHHAERAAANTPVQGAAGMVTVMALIVIDYVMHDVGMKSVLVNTVHDSIDTDVYPGELGRVAALQKDIMENITEYATVFMPDIDMSWLICPLNAEAEAGSHYGAMTEVVMSEEDMLWAQNIRRDYVNGRAF